MGTKFVALSKKSDELFNSHNSSHIIYSDIFGYYVFLTNMPFFQKTLKGVQIIDFNFMSVRKNNDIRFSKGNLGFNY